MDSVSQRNVSCAYVLAIHGGAGTVAAHKDAAPYHAALKQAAAAGEFVLAGGGSALEVMLSNQNNLLFLRSNASSIFHF